MLQRSNLAHNRIADAQDSDSIQATLAWVVGVVRRQIHLVVLVVLLSCALGAGYVLTTPKRYTSTAEMVIDTRKTQLPQQQNTMGIETPIDSAMVDSQVEIMKSESIALAVIKELRLKENKEF